MVIMRFEKRVPLQWITGDHSLSIGGGSVGMSLFEQNAQYPNSESEFQMITDTIGGFTLDRLRR